MAITTTPPTSRFPSVWFLPVSTPRRVGDIPADIVGCVGEASRGILNTPVFVGSPVEFKHTFGGMTPNPNSPGALNPLSLYPTFLGLAYCGVQDKICVRVASSLCSTGYITVSNGSGDMFALHAYDGQSKGYSPGSWASGLAVRVSANANPALFNLQLTNSATGEVDIILGLNPTDNTAMIAAINAAAKLVVATQPVVDVPTAGPTVTPSTSTGTLPAATYKVIATYTNANGETVGSPESTDAVLAAPGHLTITLPSMTGAVGIKAYVTSGASGTETYAAQNASGLTVVISAAITASAVQPPVANTAYKGAGNTSAVATVGTTSFPTVAASGKNVGNDGAGAAIGQYIGAAGNPNTGLYALTGIQPLPNFVVLAEDAGGDSTAWQTCAQVANDNGWMHVATFPRGTSDSAAKAAIEAATALTGSSIAQYIKFAFPWVWIQDNEYYKAPVRVSAAPYLAGITAVQPANTAGANKPLSNISGPEYNYSIAQMESIIADNINVVTALIPASGVGFATDLMASGDEGYLIRMRLLLAAGFQARGGPFVEVPNTPALRQQAHDTMTAFLDELAREGLIPENPAGVSTVAPAPSVGGTPKGNQPSAGAVTSQGLNYIVVCDDTNNLFAGVATRTLYIDIQCRIFPNTQYVLFRAEVGTDVTVDSVIGS